MKDENEREEIGPSSEAASPVDVLVMPNKSRNILTIMIGAFLSVVTLCLFFPVWYVAMFERKTYFNRLALYKYLKNNGLPQPGKIGPYSVWKIGNTEITYADGVWHALTDDEVSICSFTGGVFDNYRYNYIKKMLEA